MTRYSLLAIAAMLALSACWSEVESGPVEVKYNREACEFCRMIISDPRFVAEIREKKGAKVFMFDDIGDAIFWLKRDAPFKETSETEIWVRDFEAGKKWLDAKSAWYLAGQHSPMEYGFGAIGDQRENAVSFEQMRQAVTQHKPTSHSAKHDHQAQDPKHQHHGKTEKE